MSTHFDVIVRPVITEKGLTLKEAIERIFKVKVQHVRTMKVPGKMRRRGRYVGYRPDWKKAYVTLREGEKMIEYGETF
jgi:large subunit ribosomal protein L23